MYIQMYKRLPVILIFYLFSFVINKSNIWIEFVYNSLWNKSSLHGMSYCSQRIQAVYIIHVDGLWYADGSIYSIDPSAYQSPSIQPELSGLSYCESLKEECSYIFILLCLLKGCTLSYCIFYTKIVIDVNQCLRY